MTSELVMNMETVVELEASVSGTWEEQDVCSVRPFVPGA